VDYRLEVIGIPVADVDRAKAFYVELVGFELGPEGSPGSRFAFFSDPDDNAWSV
jgi:catechol 2,3-dioxygenase-like lactoylglutathione lyase family enzyme